MKNSILEANLLKQRERAVEMHKCTLGMRATACDMRTAASSMRESAKSMKKRPPSPFTPDHYLNGMRLVWWNWLLGKT